MSVDDRRALGVIRRLGVVRAADLEAHGIPRRPFIPPTGEQAAICKRIERVGMAAHRLKEFSSALISAAGTGTIDVREEAVA